MIKVPIPLQRRFLYITMILLFIFLAGCQPQPTESPTSTATVQPSVPPTNTVTIFPTFTETVTPTPTRTSRPTLTPLPPSQTPTPYPSLTPMATRVFPEDPSIVYQGEFPFRALVWLPDQHFLLAGLEGKGLGSFNLSDWRRVSFVGNDATVSELALSPDGKWIAAALENDGSIRLLEAETGSLVRTIWPAHEEFIRGITFTSDSNQIISCSVDQTIKLWDVQTGELVSILYEGDGCSDMAFTPDGSKLVVGFGYDDTVKVFSTGTWHELLSFSTDQISEADIHLDHIEDLDISPDGKYIVTASGIGSRDANVWNINTGAFVYRLGPHPSWVWAVAFSPDGKLIASAGINEAVVLWDAVTGEVLGEIYTGPEYIQSLAFSPDGQLLAAGGSVALFLWGMETLGQWIQ